MKSLRKTPIELLSYLQLTDTVIITDSNHVILDVNKEYEATTGYSSESITGLRAGFLKSRLTPQSTYTSLKSALKENKPWSGVLINRKKSGEFWHSSISITPFDSKGSIHYVGIFRELEQLKQGIYIPEVKKVEVQRDLLKVLAFSCEIRDPDIEDHLLRVQQLTERLVKAHNTKNGLGINPIFICDIIHSSILHDIGKASIPEGILYKPGTLTAYERKIIEMHPLMGVDILNRISGGANYEFIESLAVAENIIRYHHEKWDGTGYPDNLKGDEIPFEARVVAIVDVFDALTSRRPYKDSWMIQEALTYILEQKGKHFDPLLVETFIQLFNGEPNVE